MANLVHFHAAQESFPEDERLRMVAKRAVAGPGFPFDGAAMVLAQLELSAGLANAGLKPRPEK